MKDHQQFMFLSILLTVTLFSLLVKSSENSHYEFYDDGETTWALPSSPESFSSPAFLPLYTSSASSLLTSPAEIVERSISVEFSPRRRRFPFLKALVHHIVSPERRDLSLDVSGNTAAILIERSPRKKKLADIKEAIANSAASASASVAAAAVASSAGSSGSSSSSSSVSSSSPSSPSPSPSSSSVSPASVTISRSPLEAIALEVLNDSSEDNNHLEVDFVPISPTVSAHITTTSSSSSVRPQRKRGLFLINVLSRIFRSVNLTAVTEEMRTGSPSSRASCIACNAIAALYLSPLYSKDAMVAAARSVCVSFRLQTPRVCRGLVDSFKDDLDFIRRNTKLTRQEMCGVVFGMDCARTASVSDYLNWTIPIPPDSRPGSSPRHRYKRNNKYSPLNTHHHTLTSAGASLNTNPNNPHHSDVHSSDVGNHGGSSNLYDYSSSGGISVSGAVYSAVQITDVHIDPYYEVGTSADCGEPLCCRSGSPYRPASHSKIPVTSSVSNLPSSSSSSSSPSVSSASLHQSSLPSSSHTAGVWGDYRNCDTPVASLKSALEHISQTHPHVSKFYF